MTRLTPVLLACLALSPALASAQNRVYQWVDANGVRHYSQTPPPKVRVAERDIRTAEGKAAPPTAAKAKSAEEQACDVATANLTTLQTDKPVSVQAKAGDVAIPQPLNADERAAAKIRAQKEADLYCVKK
jgi:hypothetical protein